VWPKLPLPTINYELQKPRGCAVESLEQHSSISSFVHVSEGSLGIEAVGCLLTILSLTQVEFRS
jgi:hypothetical protein